MGKQTQKRCKKCNSTNIVRKGRGKYKFGFRQMYLCKDCKGMFVDSDQNKKTYNPRVIRAAISTYNLGNGFDRSARIVNHRFKIHLGTSSIHRWIHEFKGICTYSKLREGILKSYGAENVLSGQRFEYDGIVCDFKFHRGKVDLLCGNELEGVSKYLAGFEKMKGRLKYSGEADERQGVKIDARITARGESYDVCKIAGFGRRAAKKNIGKLRQMEYFMLVNDCCTVACDVPVCGIDDCVDVLQVRDGLVYVLGYRRWACRENADMRLFFYASALSRETGIKLERFRCAWFDENHYFEFEPAGDKVEYPDKEVKGRRKKEAADVEIKEGVLSRIGRKFGFLRRDK